MHISVTDAKAQLTELVRRAEAGDEIILTRHGAEVVRVTPCRPALDVAARRRILLQVAQSGARNATPGLDAARSQDFLYDDETGLPA